MPDYRDDLDESSSRHAAEWGLAAILLGGFLAVVAALLVVFNILFWVQGRNVLSPPDMRFAFKVAILGVAGAALLCLCSLAFAIKACRSARLNDQPCGLPLAGLLVSLLALGMWVIAGGNLMMILEFFTR